MDYCQMTDEELAVLTQQNDDDAFTELYHRYKDVLQYKAHMAAQKYPYYEDEFFSYFQERFNQIILKYDINRGVSVAGFCGALFPRFVSEFVRYKINKRVVDENGVKRRTTELTDRVKHLAVPVDTADNVLQSKQDDTFTFSHRQAITNTELFEYLRSKDDIYARFVALLVQGYTYEEVGRMLAGKETLEAAKSWCKRIIKKIRQETITFYAKSGSLDEIQAYV